ncbi:MAG: type II toxin-antitoxin system VapC family toxin [Verrucomicrobiales bacterium]
MNVLLDTCTFLWLALQPNRLSEAARAAINDTGNLLFLSHVSVWEVALKHSGGKLVLPATPRLWFPPRLSFFQVQLLAIEMEAFLLSVELPRVHADPFDRLLGAQAISRGFSIVTPDPLFSLLGAASIW